MNRGSVYNGEPALGVLVFVGATVSFGPGVAAFYFFISGLIVWILGIEYAATGTMKMNTGKLPGNQQKILTSFYFF